MARKLAFGVAALGLLIVAGAEYAAAENVELDSIVIEGRILRPQAAYIIQRAGVNFGIDAKKRSFVAKIDASLTEGPFAK